ncbi:uncharacterized protein LOC129195189 [Grus americana]|uniref:uncharacterized protein LOC129195189 n=1 Tax=Grus americana TaxID=9117 RepID=UPI0024081A8C|nr:uncharacterized protein LOC129195189 [Grus americana]
MPGGNLHCAGGNFPGLGTHPRDGAHCRLRHTSHRLLVTQEGTRATQGLTQVCGSLPGQHRPTSAAAPAQVRAAAPLSPGAWWDSAFTPPRGNSGKASEETQRCSDPACCLSSSGEKNRVKGGLGFQALLPAGWPGLRLYYSGTRSQRFLLENWNQLCPRLPCLLPTPAPLPLTSSKLTRRAEEGNGSRAFSAASGRAPRSAGNRLTATLPCSAPRRGKRAGGSINHTTRTARSGPRFTPSVLCHLSRSTHCAESIGISLCDNQYRDNNNQINYCRVMLGLVFGDLLLRKKG